MGVLDKILDIMKLSDDDDFENDEFFDDEDDFEEDFDEKPSKFGGFLGKLKGGKAENIVDDDFIDEPAPSKKPAANKVTPMRQPSRRAAINMEVCVIKPTTVEDAREIAETLLSGRTVILNLEGLDLEVAQRIIDFTSGATFAISGNLQKISTYIFLVTPTNVDISGDLQDLLGGASIDSAPIGSNY